MPLMPVNLRLEAADGSGIEEYRIQDGDIEVRRVRRSAEYGRFDNDWQPLTSEQLANHVKDNSVVAHWLRHRIGWRRLLLACSDPQILQSFGIEDHVRDRFAA